MNPEISGVVLVSGSDLEAFDAVLARVKKILGKKIGTFETSGVSGEPGDHLRLHEEIFNIPLFSPFRLILVRQAAEVFRPVLANKSSLAVIAEDFQERLPDRTWILIQYEGAPPKKLEKALGPTLLHLSTRDLYPNQIMDGIRRAATAQGLNLSEEALHELRERLEPRSGAIEQALKRLKERLPEKTHEHVSALDIRDSLFPNPGYNPFELVDAVYRGDFQATERELVRFNGVTDNLFAVLKLMLNRADEIRRATIGKNMGMSENELVELLELQTRPPFVRKKILQRLSFEAPRFDSGRLERVYELLLSMQKDFRGVVPHARQPLYFQERIREVFFD